MIKQPVTLILLLLVCKYSVSGQNDVKTIQDYVNETDEVFFGEVQLFSNLSKTLKKEIREGSVTAQNLKPKRIGLITTYMFDEKFTSRQSHFIYVHSENEEVNYFFNQMGEPLVEGVKSAFQNADFELVTPSAFITNTEEQEEYEKLAKQLKTADPFAQTIRDYGMNASGGEFEFIYTLSKDGESSKIMDGLADYAKTQGLDAVLSIEINTFFKKLSIQSSGELAMPVEAGYFTHFLNRLQVMF